MGSGNKDKILEIIKDIENKNLEMKEYLSSLKILSRNDILKEINRDIINNTSIIKELLGTEGQIVSKEKEDKETVEYIIDGYFNKIQNYPQKKIILIKEFLELFQDQISEKDKDVILNSLKNEKNNENLKERMFFLANTFKLNL
ncbi:MAG: hypothetical protein ACFFDF_06995 [Candidatus Odinarchaeota archaeon]